MEGIDKNTFKQIQPDEKYLIVKKTLESAIKQLEYILTKVAPDKQAEWARQEILCWRTLRETPLPRKVSGENGLAAETLHLQGWRFPREYLEYKLNRENILAVAIILHQKPVWAVPGLKQHAKIGSSLGDFARGAPAKIGTYEAFRALESSIIPRGHSRANYHLMILLRRYGDGASAEFLKNLSTDERFSEEERTSFNITREVIEKRLKKGSQPSRHSK